MPKAPKSKVIDRKKAIHPNSRKATIMGKCKSHKERIGASRHQKSLKQDSILGRYLWFKENLDDSKEQLTRTELTQMVQDYLKRFDEEIEQISIVNSIGFRSSTKLNHSSRLDSIKFTQDKEHNEFSSTGLEVPNLTKKNNVDLFRVWGGEMRFFENIEKIKISKSDADKLPDSSENVS